jgi:transposase-like protein
MRGKKGQEVFERAEPARERGNKRRGRGTASNGRPPVLGTIGRRSRQVRLRVAADVKQATLHRHVLLFTLPDAQVMTDENDSYNDLPRRHLRVSHMAKEWARDDDGDGVREVHTNSAEGMWTGLRAFLRPFRGVSQAFLSGYIAVYEFAVNLKRVSPPFIVQLVHFHYLYR